MGSAQRIRDNFGFMVWLAASVPLFWLAPRAPEAPAVTPGERAQFFCRFLVPFWAELDSERAPKILFLGIILEK